LVISEEPAFSRSLATRIPQVITERSPREFHCRLRGKDFLVQLRPYVSGDGEIDGVVANFVNVTRLLGLSRRLKSSQSKLRLLSRRQRMVIDAIPSEVAVLDRSGRIIAVNAAWRRFAAQNGYRDRKHGVGLNYFDICERATGSSSEGAAAIAEGLRKVLAGEVKSLHFDYPCHSADMRRWFRVLMTAGGGAWRGGAVVVHADITAEVEMSRTLVRQTAALQSAANAIFITDGDGQIDWVNESCLRLSGYSSEELLGRHRRYWKRPTIHSPSRMSCDSAASGGNAGPERSPIVTGPGKLTPFGRP
jgi:PAS domain-containing protein